MNVRETALPEVKLIQPKVWEDERGFFIESFHQDRFAAFNLPTAFVQDNHSRSRQNVLRGLHYQLQHPQGKLVRVIRGTVFDVAVDIRVGSPTFGRWVGLILSDENNHMLWIPPGFAHGFFVISEIADVSYKCTALFAAGDDHGVLWSDPGLAIDWPSRDPLLSDKDRRYPTLSADRPDLPVYHHG